jgi:hypothetical protein
LNVLLVVPIGNNASGARPASCIVVGDGQLSLPDGAVYDTTAPHVPSSLPTVIADGHVIAGA